MKIRILLPALLLALLSCQRPSSAPHTRGIGVYPGEPAQCFAPEILPGGRAYRNIALGRAASHSSSWDYNLTAQLVTDGIFPDAPAPWADLTVNGEALPKRERSYLTDQNVSKIVRPGPEVVFLWDMHGYEIAADKILVAGDAYGSSTASVEASSDGENWTPLGKASAVPTRNLVGENKMIRYNLEWTVKLSSSGPFPFWRLTVSAPESSEISINEMFFYRDGEVLDVQPSRVFSSSWKSEGAEDEWIAVDLGTKSSFDRMVFHWLNAPVSGEIQVSADGRVWKTVGKVAEGERFDTLSLTSSRGRYVRANLNRTANGKPFELGEWEIFGRGGTTLRAASPAQRAGRRHPLSGGGWKLIRASQTDATGEEISSLDFDDSAWMVATVPGTVLGSYVNAGAVPDPNYADNQLFISDSYFRSDFWYRDRFFVRPDNGRKFLHLGGINHRAAVWLNGTYLGEIDGAFREQTFDVYESLQDGWNSLAVRVFCNKNYGTVKEQNAYTPDGNGGVLGGDNPTMHATIGWDWIPTVRGRSMGIYDEVALVYTGPVTLEDPFVRTQLPLPDTTSATVFAEVSLVNHNTSGPVSGVLTCRFGEKEFHRDVTLPAAERTLVRFDPFVLEHPRLWWPRGYGSPELYDVSFSFKVGVLESDAVSFQTGVRQMDYKMEAYTPLTDSPFQGRNHNQRLSLYVNGRRLIGFGGNWGFPEHLLNYRDREYDIAVGYHADMNFTMIRNWVGMTDSKAFYEACDRHGVMIWQDFWLANPWDGPDPDDPGLFNEVARQYVRRIRNHPAVALYVGRNEGYPPEEIDSFLARMVTEEHPGLYYIPHSAADGVNGGGPYHALPAREYYRLHGKDKMHSERGMPNVMNYENLVRALGEEHVEPFNSVAHPNAMYGLHDYTLGREGYHAAQQAESFNELLVKAFGEPADAEEFTRLAQWINYDGYRAMFEGRSPLRRGLILWMSHPAWPSMVWQTYDYYFEPTGAYFGCRKACEPLHILLNALDGTVDVVNYRAGDRTGLTASATVYDLQGRPAGSQTAALDIPEDDTRTCFPLEVPEDITEVYFVRLKLTDADGAVLSENFYTQGKEEGNLRALRSLPDPSLRVRRLNSGVDGAEEWVDVRLANTGRTPALMIRLKALDSKTGDLILPVWYSDNYISLMPGESRDVRVRVRTEDRAGRLTLKASSCL